MNFHKSSIIGLNLHGDILEAVATFLSCSTTSVPFNFLGIPMGANPRRKATWNPILDKMRKV